MLDLRQVTRRKLAKGGALRQARILTTCGRGELPPAAVAWRMASRWREENYFRYGRGRAHPGVRLASRTVYNSEVAQASAQNNFGDIVILGVIAALAAVTMINTLAVSTVERRGQVRLLAMIGATTGQLAGAFRWQALFVTVVGTIAGAAVCAGALTGLTRAVTGSTVPYIPPAPAVLIATAIVFLTFGTIMTSFAAMSRRLDALR